MPRPIRILQTFFVIAVLIISASSSCDCKSEESIKKSEEHIKFVTKLTAMKILPAVRELIAHSNSEKLYLLERTKYDLVRDLQDTYGKLITHTDFHRYVEDLVENIKGIINNHDRDYRSINVVLTSSLQKAFTNMLPSTFLCLSMADCVTAPSEYVDCMKMHSPKWLIHFGKEQEKMARRLTESIILYKNIDHRLLELQTILTTTDTSATHDCAVNYTSITSCGSCVSENVGFCRDSCENSVSSCYKQMSIEWDQHISVLDRLIKGFDIGFDVLERGLHNALRRLVETSAPHLAQEVVNACGALGSRAPATRAAPIHNKKPHPIAKKTQKMVEQLQHYQGMWQRFSSKVCDGASQENFCWNGTNVVKAFSPIEELPPITKDVRPRPFDPRIEGSAVPWTDDEDLIPEGSGSGLPPPDLFPDQDQKIVMTATTTTTTSIPPTSVPETSRPIKNADDTMNDVIIGTEGDLALSTNSISYMFLFILMLLRFF